MATDKKRVKYHCTRCDAGVVTAVITSTEKSVTVKVEKCDVCEHQYMFNNLKYLTEVTPNTQ